MFNDILRICCRAHFSALEAKNGAQESKNRVGHCADYHEHWCGVTTAGLRQVDTGLVPGPI